MKQEGEFKISTTLQVTPGEKQWVKHQVCVINSP